MSLQPQLTPQAGRQARCTCGQTTTSSPDLAFFEYRGEGSVDAGRVCAHCAMYESAHLSEDPLIRNPVRRGECPGFEAHGAFEFDRYYCGHGGWD